MLTMKKLDEKIKKIESIIENNKPAELVIKMKLYKKSNDYNKTKQILELKKFKYIKTETTNFRYFPNEEYEVWEKTLAETYWY